MSGLLVSPICDRVLVSTVIAFWILPDYPPFVYLFRLFSVDRFFLFFFSFEGVPLFTFVTLLLWPPAGFSHNSLFGLYFWYCNTHTYDSPTHFLFNELHSTLLFCYAVVISTRYVLTLGRVVRNILKYNWTAPFSGKLTWIKMINSLDLTR